MLKEGFEESLGRSMFSQSKEKTYVDKLLGKDDIEKVKQLIKKDNLTRSELLELLYMCLGTECKLIKLDKWDRYVLLKFFVWIREFIKVAELMYDYKDFLEKSTMKLNKRTHIILKNNGRLIEHNAKFLIDLYLNIMRTTLSLESEKGGGTAFSEFLNNKFEVSYPEQQSIQPIQPPRGIGIRGIQ